MSHNCKNRKECARCIGEQERLAEQAIFKRRMQNAEYEYNLRMLAEQADRRGRNEEPARVWVNHNFGGPRVAEQAQKDKIYSRYAVKAREDKDNSASYKRQMLAEFRNLRKECRQTENMNVKKNNIFMRIFDVLLIQPIFPIYVKKKMTMRPPTANSFGTLYWLLILQLVRIYPALVLAQRTKFFFSQGHHIRSKLEYQEDETDSDAKELIPTLRSLITSFIPNHLAETAQALTIVSLFINFILLTINAFRNKGKLAYSMLMINIIGLISSVVAMVNIPDETKAEIQKELNRGMEEMVSLKLHRSLHMPGDRDQLDERLNEAEREMMVHFSDVDNITIHDVERYFSDHPYVVPPCRSAPQLDLEELKVYTLSLRYPEWLLRIWWTKPYSSTNDFLQQAVRKLREGDPKRQKLRRKLDILSKASYGSKTRLNEGALDLAISQITSESDYSDSEKELIDEVKTTVDGRIKPNPELDLPTIPDFIPWLPQIRADFGINYTATTNPSKFIKLLSFEEKRVNPELSFLLPVVAPYMIPYRKYKNILKTFYNRNDENKGKVRACFPFLEFQGEESNTQNFKSFLFKFLKRILGMVLYLGDVCTGAKFTFSGLAKSLKISDELDTTGKDILSMFSYITGWESPESKAMNMANHFTHQFDTFMKYPQHELATHIQLVYKVQKEMHSFLSWYNSLDREGKAAQQSLHGLYVVTNARVHKFFQQDIKNMSRQEPFVVLLRGDGGEGKTTLVRNMIRRICLEHLNILPEENIAEITPNDKYWPPFSGQQLAFFDDCGGKNDLKEDLLFANIKNICSPVFYNAAGADLDSKINPVNFKIIFATTNSKFRTLADSLNTIYEKNSQKAIFRRMILVDCKWNEARYGKLNVNESWKNKFDDKNFKHLGMTINIMEGGIFSPQKEVSYNELYDIIVQREKFKSNEYTMWREKKRNTTLTKQVSKSHFSVVLHGPAGQGKSYISEDSAQSLSVALGLPLIKINTMSDLQTFKNGKRVIALLDDIIRPGMTLEEENIYMDFYNERLQDGSIIINTTNVSPGFAFPAIDFGGIYPRRSLPFRNVGLSRRIGYVGRFGDGVNVSTNLEFRVSNLRYFRIVGERFISFVSRFSIWDLVSFGSIEKEILQVNFSDTLYNAYREFLNISGKIEIRDVPEIVCESDNTLAIVCENSNEFMKVENRMDLEKHVFTDPIRFDDSTLSWKILCTPTTFAEITSNIDRYRLSTFSFTRDGVISIISRYATAFKLAGHEPKFYFRFNDIGTFSFREGILKISTNLVMNDNSFQLITKSGKLFVASGFLEIPLLRAVNFSVDEITNFGISLTLAHQLRAFLKSPTFMENPRVIAALRDGQREMIKNKTLLVAKTVKDKFLRFIKTPLGILAMIVFGVLTTGMLASLLYGMFSKSDLEGQGRKSGHRRGDVRSRDLSPPRRTNHEGAGGRKGMPKKVNGYITDPEKDKRLKESVNTLKDMNSYAAYMPYMDSAFKQSDSNLCQIYKSLSKMDIIPEEPASPCCYGLFVAENIFVTVGHITEERGDFTYYVGKDGLKGFHRAVFVCSPKERDLSVWYVPTMQSVKDITQNFYSINDFDPEQVLNVAFRRLAGNKVNEFHSSNMYFYMGEEYYIDSVYVKMGVAFYASISLKISTFGDCGLPYFVTEKEPKHHNKITGIHCMGSDGSGQALGVCSLIFREDIQNWKELVANLRHIKQSFGQKGCCEFAVDHITIKEDDKPKCKGHKTVWHEKHESTMATFVEEYQDYLKFDSNFTGTILKHSGTLKGSEEHSHTQFLPFQTGWIEEEVGPAKIVDLAKYIDVAKGQGTLYCFEIPCKNFVKKMLSFKSFENNFRVLAERYHSPKSKQPMLRVRILTTFIDKAEREALEGGLVGLDVVERKMHYGEPTVVSPIIRDIFEGYRSNRERGRIEDVPFHRMENNATVFVTGVTTQNKSHIPANHFKVSPFSKIVEKYIPIEKRPCEYRLEFMDPKQRDELAENNFGMKCPRTTLSLLWAHKFYGNKFFLDSVCSEFIKKIRAFYSDLRVMTDEEVLGGCAGKLAPYFKGMELDTAIGFTAKELFYVMKKSDVVHCDDKGRYSWLDNPAARWMREQYLLAKQISSTGRKYHVAFLELLKMEKLKLSKYCRGRTFVAQDMLGVLMERRNLGMFCVRAMRDDPTCGVGTDPIIDFNRHYIRLNRFSRLWAGDYSNYDRSIPASVLERIGNMLAEVNPGIANEIKSSFSVIIERIMITGTTVCEVKGGLPSGCFVTAPLNSICNDFILFSAFVKLCMQLDVEFSWQLYEDNVVRLTYGDDVIVTVSERFSDVFTRANVSGILREEFGMTLGSSAKDGSDSTFDTYETASWVSRFFRKLDRFDVRVGALKKISIGALFHYVTQLDLGHLGDLMEMALGEAALWEPEYYETVLQAVQACMAWEPRLCKHVNLRSRLAIQEDTFYRIGPNALPLNRQQNSVLTDWNDLIAEDQPAVAEQQQQIKYFDQRYFLTKQYRRKLHIMNKLIGQNDDCSTVAKTYSVKLNEAFQAGKITKPIYTYTKNGPDERPTWECQCGCVDQLTGKHITHKDNGYTKASAREGAAYLVCRDLGIAEALPLMRALKHSFTHLQREMDVSAAVVGSVPRAPMTQTDVSVVADGGLYTNTMAPVPTRIYNPLAMALDNPAGTGIPFDLKDSVYNIYQRWESKNTTISPSLSAGAVVFTLSLNPSTWPTNLLRYVEMHNALIPALDIIISIAGASGTIGWLAVGWLPDDTITPTLDMLQQVSLEEVNMNGTQVIKTTLTDIRKSGLYRNYDGETEPYPCIVMMIDHAVTNVQRNDSVNYPIRVQAKLNPSCILMSPYRNLSTSTSTLDAGSYFSDELDLIIGSSATTEDMAYTTTFDVQGTDTTQFVLKFSESQIRVLDYTTNEATWGSQTMLLVTDVDRTKFDPTIISEITTFNKWHNTALPPSKLVVGFGKCAPRQSWHNATALSGKQLVGSVYQLSGKIRIGNICYNITQLYKRNDGCDIVLEFNGDVITMTRDSTNYRYLVNYESVSANSNNDEFVLFKPDSYVNYVSVPSQKFLLVPQTTNVTNSFYGVDCSSFQPNGTATDACVVGTTRTYTGPTYNAFVQTGNTLPSINLPIGLKELQFSDINTTSTVTRDLPFVAFPKDGIAGVQRALDNLLSKNGWAACKFELYIGGSNRGEVGYLGKRFVVRSDEYRLILPRISNQFEFRNIDLLENAQGLTVFNTSYLDTWTTTTSTTRERVRFLFGKLEKQAAMIGAGLLQGVGSGLSDYLKQQFQSQMYDKILNNQKLIAQMNNEAIAQRQKDAFERNMKLTGYNSSSAQYGVASGGTVGLGFRSGGTQGGGVAPTQDLITNNVSGVSFDSRGNRQNLFPTDTLINLDPVSGLEPTRADVNVNNSKLNPEAKIFDPTGGEFDPLSKQYKPQLNVYPSGGVNEYSTRDSSPAVLEISSQRTVDRTNNKRASNVSMASMSSSSSA